MIMPHLKALEVEALTYIYSPKLNAPEAAARTVWWRTLFRGHAITVGVTAALGLLGMLVWRLLPG